jgi:uncharacterized membrane-anchored protein
MEKQRIRCVISGLKRFELTESENRFIFLAEQNLNQEVLLDEKIEAILEWIYSQKTEFIKDSVFSLLQKFFPSRFPRKQGG